jgi:hypothetical protein
MFTRLMVAYQQGLVTLDRPRAGGKQTIIVQHVHVNEGGRRWWRARFLQCVLTDGRGRVSKRPQQDMSQDDVLLNAGKEQGEVIAAYLIRRMHEGRITPTEAVNVVAVRGPLHLDQRALWANQSKSPPPQSRCVLLFFQRPANANQIRFGVCRDHREHALNPGASFRSLHDSPANHIGNTMSQMLLCLHEEHAVAVM